MSYDITALHNSKLVITAKVIPGNKNKYYVVITDVLKNTTDIKLAVSDKIKVLIPDLESFGTKSRVYESEYILYLNTEGKYWKSTYGASHIKATEAGLIPFDTCDRTYLLSPKNYKQMNHDLFMCFNYKTNYKYDAILTPAQYQKKNNPLDVVLQFYRCYTHIMNVNQDIDESEFLGPDFIHVDTTVYDFCETESGLLLTPNEFMDYLIAEVPDSISNNKLGIQGVIYVKFVIEADSSGSQFKVVKGIHPSYDAFALELAKSMAPFVPGTIHGLAVRSIHYLPIPIKKK
jgi:hypothetical protein